MTDLQGAWLFTTLIIVVFAILSAVIQGFALHAALARAKVHAPELAGLGLLFLWALTIGAWLFAGMVAGSGGNPEHGTAADVTLVWLAVIYPLTGWPAAYLAFRKGVRLGGWYWPTLLGTALTLFALGGFSLL